MTAAAVRARTLSVQALTEDGWMVRGTQDPHTALQAVLERDDLTEVDSLLYRVERCYETSPAVAWYDAMARRDFGDRLHELLAGAIVGLWRLLPVTDSLVCDWEYEQVPAKKCGVFEGVLFQ